MLALFRRVAETVPAYGEFLREHGVDPGTVRTMADFRRLPLLTKDNYHRRHPLPRLCRDGRLDRCDMVAVSSGSTGQPTIWPRAASDEAAVAARFEQVFRGSFRAHERSTLADEILRVLPELGPHFDQVVLLGYPPFVKNVIDAGLARGLDWPAYRIKLVLAGEVFSEEWRDLVGARAGTTDPCHDSASLYGTADAGVLAVETPLSVSIRRFLAQTPDAARELFGSSRLPTLAQYDPASRYFETHEGTLLFSGDNGIPLVRYHIADEGGLVPYESMLEFCARAGFTPDASGAPAQPFVFVFGRSFFTVSYFGANVYPENVTVGLEQPSVSDWVTGKFVLEAVEDADRDRCLRVTVELASAVSADSAKEEVISAVIAAQLRRLNSEFAHYVPVDQQLPQVLLRPAGDPEWFPPGVKHRYTRP